jgi:alkylhydroperoxidase family enzyme
MVETWLPTTEPGATLLEQMSLHSPAYGAALVEVLDAIWDQDVLDAPTLELCRLRIGQLLGGAPVPERVEPSLAEAVRYWPNDPRFDPRLRTILGYAEQLLLDAQELNDEQVMQVTDAIGEDGFLVLTYACGVFETTQRAELILGTGKKAT